MRKEGFLIPVLILLPIWFMGVAVSVTLADVVASEEVIINEVLVTPDNGTIQSQYVELVNTTNDVVEISGWVLKPASFQETAQNGITPFYYQFGDIVCIAPHCSIVLSGGDTFEGYADHFGSSPVIFTGDPLGICATLGPLGLWTGDPNGDSANLSDYIGFDTLVPPETGAAPLAAAPGPPDAGESYQRCPEGPAAGYQSSGGLLERHTACTDNGALAAKSPGADKTGAQFTGCDGNVDEGAIGTTWYQDSDGDNYGNAAVFQQACEKPGGYVADDTDCDDTVFAVNPGATEICNGIDDNCDGRVDEGDLNHDGKLDRLDYFVLRTFLNQPLANCSECDLNEDGVINFLDLRQLIFLMRTR